MESKLLLLRALGCLETVGFLQRWQHQKRKNLSVSEGSSLLLANKYLYERKVLLCLRAVERARGVQSKPTARLF
jgi:hypothetical protein